MATTTVELHIKNQADVDQTLCCPRCGDPWLHYRSPDEIVAPYRELRVPICCDSCGKTSELMLRAHKGQLFVSWNTGPVILSDMGL
jgi:hypothetical protein